MKSTKFPIYLFAKRLSSNSQKAITLVNTKKLGELKNKQVIYSPFEAFYLIEKNKAELIKNNKPLTKQQAEKTLLKSKNLTIKYPVFKYLRQKGYIVKTGLKFGGDFRVYSPTKDSKNPLITSHAKYICFSISELSNLNLKDFISKNRIAHSTAKKLLLAIVDTEQSILFYEVDWVKP